MFWYTVYTPILTPPSESQPRTSARRELPISTLRSASLTRARSFVFAEAHQRRWSAERRSPPCPALAPARLGRSATLWRRGWARAATGRVRPPLAQPRGLPSAWRRCPQRPRGSRAGGETFLVFHSELHMPLLDFHRIAPSSVTRQRSSHSERPAGESSGVISVIWSHLGHLESSRGGASHVVWGEGSRHLGLISGRLGS